MSEEENPATLVFPNRNLTCMRDLANMFEAVPDINGKRHKRPKLHLCYVISYMISDSIGTLQEPGQYIF